MKLSKKFAVAVAASALIGSAGLANPVKAGTADNIIAGGATFPQNLIESCRATFAGDTTANPLAATVNYTGVGSGTGRSNFFDNVYDGFAMSDSMWSSSNSKFRTALDSPSVKSFVWLPLISGAINVAYRLDGVKPAGTVLQLTPTTIAKIFAGTIKTWNDASIKLDNPVAAKPKLSGLNGAANFALAKKGTKAALTVSLKPSVVNRKTKNMVVTSSTDGGVTSTRVYNAKPKAGKVVLSLPYAVGTEYTINYNNVALGTVSIDATSVVLPATPITVYHRKETSGTTNNFLNFLNKTVPAVWTTAAADAFLVPSGTNPTDGSFVGAQGNDGVANGVMSKDGGIGYAEVSFVNERQVAGKSITSAKVMNPAGEFLAGTSAGAAKFVDAAAVNSTTGVVTFDYTTKAAGAYPITAVSYFMANTSANTNSANSAAKMLTAQRFANYVLDTCAPAVAELKGYAALPANIVAISKTLTATIK
jgi:phosphate transport system substrate-binding protein